MSIDDVRTLVAERQRYDDWLLALESRRGSTPARVFDRVHADYAGRRSGVMEQLSGHIDTLAGMGHELDARLAALDESLAGLEDEHVEAMLRTEVGEFDSDRWENVRQQVEARIAGLSSERSALITELEDVRTLLGSARNEPPAPASGAVNATAPAGGGAAGLAADTTSAGATGPSSGANDAIFTAALTSMATPAAPEQRDGSAPGASFTSERTAEPGAAVAVGETGSSERLPSGDALDLDSALALFSPTSDSNGHGNSHGTANGGGTSAGAVDKDSDPFDDLAFLRSVIDPTSEGASSPRGAQAAAPAAPAANATKTLRCTECGTMNLPTEWYCERCGGELAAF